MRTRNLLLILTAVALVAVGCSDSTAPTGREKRVVIQAIGVGDLVWMDRNGDGIQDLGEPGLPGVEVRLLDCAGTPLDTMITLSDGSYGFGTLDAGDYSVWFDLPDGYTFSPQFAGQDTTMDSDADPATGVTPCFSLSDGEINTTVDAGMVPPPEPQDAAIGDFVWHDENGDGIQDPGEPGVPGVEVRLWACAGDVMDTTWTDMNGLYGFADVPADTYMIQFVLPDGYAFSPQHAGADTTRDSDADPETGITACFAIAADQQDPTRDAGLTMVPTDDGCTHSKGYWKNHAGCRSGRDDLVTDLLPLHLGDEGGAKTLVVADACDAYMVLRTEACRCGDKGRDDDGHGHGDDHDNGRGDERGKSNGIAKLYTHLLATKLNIANGADDADIAATVDEVDAFLADHDCDDWSGLAQDDRRMVLRWKNDLEDYTGGRNGPGSCDRGDGCDDDDDDDHDDDDDDDDDDDGDHGGDDHR